MEISQADIYDRANIEYHMNPMMGDDAQDEARLDEARLELEEEHLWRCFEVFDEAIEALDGHPDSEAVAWMLMKGWNSDLDEGVSDSWNLYFNDWEISRRNGQAWLFDHQILPTNFLDVDLLNGLEVCESHDDSPFMKKARLVKGSKLNKVHTIQLDRLISQAYQQGVEAGILINDNIIKEAMQKTAIGGSK
jgi:hypothetical protein